MLLLFIILQLLGEPTIAHAWEPDGSAVHITWSGAPSDACVWYGNHVLSCGSSGDHELFYAGPGLDATYAARSGRTYQLRSADGRALAQTTVGARFNLYFPLAGN
jgi:hypothetical protein